MIFGLVDCNTVNSKLAGCAGNEASIEVALSSGSSLTGAFHIDEIGLSAYEFKFAVNQIEVHIHVKPYSNQKA